MNDKLEPISDRMRRRSDYECLRSWKAIANYFDRSVRTVRRWEAHEGLPVHRHKHGRGSSVYAHVAELDAWRAEQLAPPPTMHPPQHRESIKSKPLVGISNTIIAIAACVVVSLVIGILWSNGRGGPVDASRQLVTVIVASPENVGNTDNVGEVLESALHRDLSNVNGLHVVHSRRVEKVMKLMRLSGETRLTVAVASEVAKRDGNIQVVIVPQV